MPAWKMSGKPDIREGARLKHLIAAYVIILISIFGYLLSISIRHRALSREITSLRKKLTGKG
jgi:CcmD family protein